MRIRLMWTPRCSKPQLAQFHAKSPATSVRPALNWATIAMEAASSQLLRALRGKRSQRAFARRLGFRANPVTDWEHGRRYPTAQETLRAAARVGKNVTAAFA